MLFGFVTQLGAVLDPASRAGVLGFDEGATEKKSNVLVVRKLNDVIEH